MGNDRAVIQQAVAITTAFLGGSADPLRTESVLAFTRVDQGMAKFAEDLGTMVVGLAKLSGLLAIRLAAATDQQPEQVLQQLALGLALLGADDGADEGSPPL